LVRQGQGWKAVNTDAIAAVSSLVAHLPEDPDGSRRPISSRTVLILGAGGVARAVAHALQQERANVTLTNRTLERAQLLAADVGCRYVEWEARHSGVYDTLINCTSVGMHPDMDEMPIHASFLKEGMLVFDTVYNPETTMLLREARERGCHTLTGVDMFVRQAGLQFELFTGRQPPYELMFKLVRRALSPITIRDDEALP
jgi:3-dehydroquinate dehydratase/shikimate dehydrogenase